MRTLIVALLALGIITVARAEMKPLKPGKEWKGRISHEQAKSAPKDGYVAGPKALAKLWKDWKLAGKVPAIDFKKEIVLVATSGGSSLGLSASLDTDKGDLEISSFGTDDIRPDSAYRIIAVSRAGVKSINGKKPKFEAIKAEEP